MNKLGWVEGERVLWEWRQATRPDQLHALARQLVALGTQVIVCEGTDPTRAASEVTRDVPIVMFGVSSPMQQGFIEEIARPGTNVTGYAPTSKDLAPKQLEIFKEILPSLARVGLLWDPSVPERDQPFNMTDLSQAARTMGVALTTIEFHDDKELANSEEVIKERLLEGILYAPSRIVTANDFMMATVIQHTHVPVVATSSNVFAEAFGLFVYGPDLREGYHRTAAYIDRLLRGAKPSDLPVERSGRVILTANLRVARTLGITFPPTVLARADRIFD